jgi:PilZ domain-containing protein
MTAGYSDRRAARRQHSIAEHGIVSARVRPGIEASVVNVSAGGALIETSQRLLPGTSIEICFDQEKRLPAVRGRVLRCAVTHLRPDQICYRGAILFDHRLSWLTDPCVGGYSVPAAETRLQWDERALATQTAS